MTHVWLVQSGDYENWGVYLVAASREAAIAAVKRSYPSPPYRVVWYEQGETLVGEFGAVMHLATERTEKFELSCVVVEQ